ncbi:hypothetical protein E1I69_09935 [Bacillus timonensis]|uniref:Uncharacterized protein n=1 Tax=Bacillus timonensis TaxID=1033734 RepID=A0A4S3PTN1_9BACI|nr:hypothetical protein [Bacillus timonensis]THE12706.1 hypothetical protein E1I69_09935 [Bacillus timonensis]
MNNRNDEWLQPLKNRPNLEPNPVFAKKLKESLKENQTVKRRNFSGVKMWLSLTMAVMLFSILTVSYVKSNPDQGQKPVQIEEPSNVINPDFDMLLAENPAYQSFYNSVLKATGIEEASQLVIKFFEALKVEDKEFLKKHVFFVANPEKEVEALLDFYKGMDVSSLAVNSFKESQAEPSVEIVFSYKQNDEEKLHHILVNYWEEGKVEIYAPLDDYVPEIENDLELNEQERTAYEAFKVDHNPEALRNLGPISVAKIYIQANADGDQETSYALYTTREDRVMWSKEEDKKYWEQENRETRDPENYKKSYYGLGSGTFQQENEFEGYITYRNKNGDQFFSMVKDENGVWKVSFMPIQ